MKFTNILKECHVNMLEEATLVQLVRSMENNPDLELSSVPSGIIPLSMNDRRPAKVEDVDKLVKDSYIPNEKKVFASRMLRNFISTRNSTNLDKAVSGFKDAYSKTQRPSFGR